MKCRCRRRRCQGTRRSSAGRLRPDGPRSLVPARAWHTHHQGSRRRPWDHRRRGSEHVGGHHRLFRSSAVRPGGHDGLSIEGQGQRTSRPASVRMSCGGRPRWFRSRAQYMPMGARVTRVWRHCRDARSSEQGWPGTRRNAPRSRRRRAGSAQTGRVPFPWGHLGPSASPGNRSRRGDAAAGMGQLLEQTVMNRHRGDVDRVVVDGHRRAGARPMAFRHRAHATDRLG